MVVGMVAAARKEVTKTKFFFTKINNFIILINIVLNRITIALIKIFFDKIIIGISIIIQVELMAGGRMSLSWEFKEERLHFTLVSTYFIFHILHFTLGSSQCIQCMLKCQMIEVLRCCAVKESVVNAKQQFLFIVIQEDNCLMTHY